MQMETKFLRLRTPVEYGDIIAGTMNPSKGGSECRPETVHTETTGGPTPPI